VHTTSSAGGFDSILGTDSEIADKYYTHVGDFAQRQAVEAISGESKRDCLKNRVQQVLALLASKPTPTQEVLEQVKNILINGGNNGL